MYFLFVFWANAENGVNINTNVIRLQLNNQPQCDFKPTFNCNASLKLDIDLFIVVHFFECCCFNFLKFHIRLRKGLCHTRLIHSNLFKTSFVHSHTYLFLFQHLPFRIIRPLFNTKCNSFILFIYIWFFQILAVT